MDRVVSSRNFCNKLWNAGKFILMNLQSLDEHRWQSLETADFSLAESLHGLPLTERWILSATHQVTSQFVLYASTASFCFDAGCSLVLIILL